ncbi:SDR family NAD(P)-dependent oxidoreductase [uncultured Cohaesibacter sp.]|uniref:SDR family NAD(P)-dependent oxidoreductase n=1 Tax=uncultured Cohaesibacter sp. TaxID=1002546 RepID=UPI0029C72773|nr:SDR family NAD(P)-dependent oxidoreductase [uncultured Cohaesibacter sp.]
MKPRVLITGGSAGIGYELAKLLASDGYDLIINGASKRVHEAAESLRSYGGKVIAVQSDLSYPAGVDELVDVVKRSEGGLDVLVLNAGIAVGGAFLDLPLEQHLHLIDLNIMSTVRLCHALLPDVIVAKGKVLMVSSLSATTPTPFESVYGPSKAFMTSFGHGLREELRDTGITLTLLHPGATATEFHARAGMGTTAFGDNSWKNDPALVAQQGYNAMMAGVTSLTGGDEATQAAGRDHLVTSEEEKARRHAEQARPGSRPQS